MLRISKLIAAGAISLAFAAPACVAEDDGSSRSQRSALEEKPGVDKDDDSKGCTLTQGYWKNHETAWPVSSLKIGGVNYTQAELLALLWTPPKKGDASLILGHQLIAALLNVNNGAGTSASVTQALSDADAWMAANKDADGRLPYAVKDSDATRIADTLASFNEGSTGTPHCDDPGGGGGSDAGGGKDGGGASGQGGGDSGEGGSGCNDGGGGKDGGGEGGKSGGEGGSPPTTNQCPAEWEACTGGECDFGYNCLDKCCVPKVY